MTSKTSKRSPHCAVVLPWCPGLSLNPTWQLTAFPRLSCHNY